MDLLNRPRRLRRSENIRGLVRETHLSVDDFIMPMFISFGNKIKKNKFARCQEFTNFL